MPVATVDIRNLAQTWNDTGTDFTAIKLNVTDTASGANSNLLDLQVGGTSQFCVSKSGGLTNKYLVAAGVTIGAAFAIGGAGTNQYSLHCGDANTATPDYIFWSLGSPTSVLSNKAGTASKVSLNSSGLKLASDGYLRWGTSHAGRDSLSPSVLYVGMDAANTLAQRNGANAQAFNLYNTYTDGSNYERGFMRWNSNELEIGTESAGTGSGRTLAFWAKGSLPLRLDQNSAIFYGTVYTSKHYRMAEQASAPAAVANSAIIFAEDDGSGKTRLMARFGTGVPQQLASEGTPSFSSTPTWNDAGTDFTAMLLNVTDTASGSGSLLLDLQVGGTSQCKVTKSGTLQLSNGAYILPLSVYHLGFGRGSTRCAIGGTNGDLTHGLTMVGTGFIGWNSDVNNLSSPTPDLTLCRKSADQLIQRRDTNPQGFYLANTWTDASNNELGFMRWESNDLVIGTESNGIGSPRTIRIECNGTDYLFIGSAYTGFRTHVYPTQPSQDLGTLTNPWRNIHLSPSSSLTPESNGDLCIEATNDTTLTFKYKGSDTTVRSIGLPLSGSNGYTQAQNFAQTTLTDAASIAWAVDTNQATTVTLAGNRTLANPTGMKAGGTYILVVKQDATGSRTLAFDTLYKFPGGVAPTLSTGANAKDLLTFYYDGEHMLCIDAKDFQ